MCFVVTCLERADLLAFVCDVYLWICHFPIGILGQVWYLIVSIFSCFPYMIQYKTCDPGAGQFLTPGALFEQTW